MINKEKFYKKRVFYGILDWGLGHTTRSIPIIRYLLELGMDVTVACNSTQSKIIREELPQIHFLPLEGYNLHFGRSSFATRVKIGLQSLNILTKIKSENRWLEEQIARQKPDIIISDNRYGFRNSQIPSVLITHQLQVKTGAGFLADALMKVFIRSQLKHFSSCWVPDGKEAPALAGALSHPDYTLPGVIRYIGPLSRLEPTSRNGQPDTVVVLLSGPEPQRSMLEEKIAAQIYGYIHPIVIVRGKPEGGSVREWPSNVTVKDHVTAAELNDLLEKARYVISRSGYTTLMDMFRLGKKLIAIPTPGQAEQEYLGHTLHAQQKLLCIPQAQFTFQEALKQAAHFNFIPEHTGGYEDYRQVILEELDRLL